MIQGVDRLGAGGFEEELRDVGASLVERLDAVGEVAPIGIRLAGEGDQQVRLGLRARSLASHRATL